MRSQYLAHTENDLDKVHDLDDHLKCVGDLAEKFICEANAELGEQAKWAGLLHDLGKYRDEFQDYLVGKRESSMETHHAIYGAALAFQKRWISLAFAIAGHHAGLHDWQNNKGTGLESLVKNPNYRILTSDVLSELQTKFESEEILPKIPQTLGEIEFLQNIDNNFKFEFATRMIFSCLVDADFLDTEKHYRNGAERKVFEFKPKELLAKLEAERLRKVENARANKADEKLIEIRNQIFDNCLQKAEKKKGFFSLTVPTGGGKTMSGMAFALKHAEIHKLRRVIVVIPYLSIIEQNAKEYREILGEEIVIENHSAVKIKSEEAEETAKSEKRARNFLEYATENWDAPIIVTTSVQFIESLFAHKTSKNRKLHNIANSVVIFDEIQTLPAKLLEPLFSVWRELKENYGVSFVFSTATQPAFRQNHFNFKNGLSENELVEITDNTDETFQSLNRVNYEFKEFQTPKTWDEIAAEMSAEKQVVCVLNTRRHAFELYGKLAESEKKGLFHLSSSMCAEHRLEVIETIKERLKNDEICRVVSTQLVEAGVDLDFPVLYRAIAPLDSIVQAAGRCNREGKLKDNKGDPKKGYVKVFTPKDEGLPQGVYKNGVKLTKRILPKITSEELACNKTIDGETIFASYFSNLYDEVGTDLENIQRDRRERKFRTVSKKAKVIDDSGTPVIVRFRNKKGDADSYKIIEQIRAEYEEKYYVKRMDMQKWLRRLQRFMVNVRKNDLKELKDYGKLEELFPNMDLELFVLKEEIVKGKKNYDENLGILVNSLSSLDLIC